LGVLEKLGIRQEHDFVFRNLTKDLEKKYERYSSSSLENISKITCITVVECFFNSRGLGYFLFSIFDYKHLQTINNGKVSDIRRLAPIA
jgi:hypothetical protein